MGGVRLSSTMEKWSSRGPKEGSSVDRNNVRGERCKI